MNGHGQVADLTRQRLIRHGLAAAVTLVERLGLSAGESVVLSNRGNLLVHFPAVSLVARVATLTAWTRREPFQWLAREVAVARYVAGRGGPVVPPAHGVDPGPHWQDGFAISLWEHVASAAPAALSLGARHSAAVSGPPSPQECGALLARFHAIAWDCPAELGDLSPAREQVTDALAVIERERLADNATIARLRAAHARVLEDIGRVTVDLPRLVLHGDAHAGNVMRVAGGMAGSGSAWAWVDLEETTRGPAGWDLATLTARYDEAGGRAALRAYASELAGAPGLAAAPVSELKALAPFRRARDLEAAVWLLCMAHLYPERYAAPAQAQLAAMIAPTSR
jgi:aminoglycoside phosphotransferase (APT) family kinase protein